MQDHVRELETRARALLAPEVFDYISQGSRDSVTTGEASAAWERHRFAPRVMRDVSVVDTGVELLGSRFALPFAIAPTTLQRAVHADGEMAMAEAAAASDALLVLSSNCGTTFEDIGSTGAAWWLQMYVTADRSLSQPLVERAAAAGASGVVLTVDTPVVATKYDSGPAVWDSADPAWVRVNFPDGHEGQHGHEKAGDLGPQDIAWLTGLTGLPVVVKGVLRADDARRCVDAGAAAVWVSNHGGRQLDRTVATADALPPIAREVAVDEQPGPAVGAAQVYVDGGVRSATHALLARALGADAVFLGRPALWALAVGGREGVIELLEVLRADLVEGLRLAGAASWSQVPTDLAVPQSR